jgi:hypothetical protein
MLMSFRNVKFAGLVIKPTIVGSGFKHAAGRTFAYIRFNVNHPLAKEFEVSLEVDRGDDWIKLLATPVHVEDLKRRVSVSLKDIVPQVIGVSDLHVIIDDVDNWEEAVEQGFAAHVYPQEEDDTDEKPSAKTTTKRQAAKPKS